LELGSFVLPYEQNQHKSSVKRGEKSVAGMKKISDQPSGRRRAPALDPAAREQQLISLAVDLAEKKLLDGSASNQLIVHYLKLATTREQLEKAKIEKEIAQLDAKTNAIQSTARLEELFLAATNAMKSYGASINKDDGEDL
jgi:hypothetical protein